MLSGYCTEALSIQANGTISGSSTKLTKNGIAPLPFPLPALLKQCPYIKRGERVRVRGHAPFYATLGLSPTSTRNFPATEVTFPLRKMRAIAIQGVLGVSATTAATAVSALLTIEIWL